MQRTAAFVLMLAVAAGMPVHGQRVTARIRIRDLDQRSTVEITNVAILGRFDIWSGRGTFIEDVEEHEGFIIDWRNGVIDERPRGLRRYEVSFFVAPSSGKEELAYAVLYEHDVASSRGFVYLPGPSDRQYEVNARAIVRGGGLEGHWFRATPEWQRAFGAMVRGRPSP